MDECHHILLTRAREREEVERLEEAVLEAAREPEEEFDAFHELSLRTTNNNVFGDSDSESESGGIVEDDSDVPDLDGDRARGHDGKFYDVDDPQYEWKTGRTPCGDD